LRKYCVNAAETHETFLVTVRPDGRPHVAGVGALWVDGRFHFTSGAGTRKSRNLAARPDCLISVKLPDLDLVVEGGATKVTDEPTLQRLAERDLSDCPAAVNRLDQVRSGPATEG
jgi:hypothetical protein